jgi:hypothetical protein
MGGVLIEACSDQRAKVALAGPAAMHPGETAMAARNWQGIGNIRPLFKTSKVHLHPETKAVVDSGYQGFQNTNSDLLKRDVQCNILLHDCSPGVERQSQICLACASGGKKPRRLPHV